VSCGFEEESRPFRPHLTLGRARDAVALTDTDGLVPRVSFEADRIYLVRSDLGRGGARYTDLHSVSLEILE
jgi:2'-5' RNA ligase